MKTRCLLLLLATAIAQGQVKRALLVGIDRYTPNSGSYKVSDQTRARLQAIHGTPSRSKLDSLEGAFNDAQAMKEMLVQKFGFDERNVIVLPNAQQPATADNILNLLQSFLIDQAKPGDISFFYYAGHGSRIRNTATRNAGGFDSTIVPADALLGVPDIRSKELARIYAQAPKKHVALTVIQDSCFSGAASRGAIARDRTRSQPPDLSISVNEKLDGPLPEDAGVLVISASQEYEPAAELASTDLNGAHGAFTWALLHALGVSPTGERVDRIFQRARALMQSRAPGQEPVLLAKNGLNTRDLFGQPAAPDSTLTMAASRVNGNVVKLNGGIAMDLHEGCELKRVRPSGDPVRLRITKVNGLSSSEAVIVDGPGVKPGDLFVLDKWVAPDREMLRVYFGPTAPREQIEAAVSAAQALKKSGLLIEDPTVHSPSHVIEWDGAHWTLRLNQPGAIREPADLAAVSKSLPHNAQVNLMLPPAADLALPPNVARVQAIDRADYVLLGRATDQAVEYAWALPDITEQDLRDRPSPRPLRSDWIPWNADAPSTLRQSALTLARVSGWLQLAASAPGSPWPYHLALERADSGRLLESSRVHGQETYRLVLKADPETLRHPIAPRRVYVFVVDSWGEAKLVFGENLENEFPRMDGAPPERIELPGTDLTVGEPYGADHYFLLATSNPIDTPDSVLSFEGARTRSADKPPADPLARLLRNTATGTRGQVSQVPVNWSIQETTILSLPPGKE